MRRLAAKLVAVAFCWAAAAALPAIFPAASGGPPPSAAQAIRGHRIPVDPLPYRAAEPELPRRAYFRDRGALLPRPAEPERTLAARPAPPAGPVVPPGPSRNGLLSGRQWIASRLPAFSGERTVERSFARTRQPLQPGPHAAEPLGHAGSTLPPGALPEVNTRPADSAETASRPQPPPPRRVGTGRAAQVVFAEPAAPLPRSHPPAGSPAVFPPAEPSAAELPAPVPAQPAVRINRTELAARIAGVNLALQTLEAELDRQQEWTAANLALLVEEVDILAQRYADAMLYYQMLSENERPLVGRPESPERLIAELVGIIGSVRSRVLGSDFTGSPPERLAELEALDAVARRLLEAADR